MAIDYVTAVLAVGLWAVLKGHRPVWARPVSFVAMMFIGGALGMADRAMPYVDPGILASIVVMGLLVAFAIDLPSQPAERTAASDSHTECSHDPR